mmetsp:Transcript_33281/g.48932  ORF Transcript_33281/g.48932 Transcript_33281/m.48932 type:complete len:217 (+) Transcript_33281:152-802(+)|eukprot:CAMPEP_0195518578 /NCGR_PEP_ID=MMETSP0794_2-20130614/13220_1 /TAXON_ID=515487 /ORGANISM="Stephanopyxis turris, Strain CCMP 815" /LENGTH=216 /DNA_ID=CAMNT_0040647579 /DNA_START=140 /DNA_END=790 /DNA_ORIENTATION=-
MNTFLSIAPLIVIAITVISSRTSSALSLRGNNRIEYINDASSYQMLRNIDVLEIENIKLDFTCSENPATCDRTSYYTYHWDDLCPYLQEIAQEHLGFNRTIWNRGEWSPTFHKNWRDLTEEQKRANELFCWGEEVWCSEDPATCNPMDYGDYLWGDLCDYLQEEAKVLGFDEEIWNYGLYVQAQDYEWDELPESPINMKKAAKAFCFNETSWNMAH